MQLCLNAYGRDALIGKPILASAVAFVALRFPTERPALDDRDSDSSMTAPRGTYSQGWKWLVGNNADG